MVPYLLAALGLWFAQVFFAASFKTVLTDEPNAAMLDHMRGKDSTPELSTMGARASRAQNNLLESLIPFLALAILLEIKGAPELGITGAGVFLVGRALYVPAYLLAVLGLRTAMWTIGFVGLAMMGWALVGG